MQKFPDPFFNLENCVPSLREELNKSPLNLSKVWLVAIPIEDPAKGPPNVPAIKDRRLISFSDGKDFCFWEPEGLQTLFRGDKEPPVLGDYPETYNDAFMLLDLHVLEISKFFGDRRDAEMLEIFSTLRRRPDGKSLGFVH